MKMLTGCCVQCSTEVMKRIFPSLFLAAATLSLAPGCVERRVEYIQAPPPPPGGEVVVNEAPPLRPKKSSWPRQVPNTFGRRAITPGVAVGYGSAAHG